MAQGTIITARDTKNKHTTLLDSTWAATAANTWECTGKTFTLDDRSLVEVRLNYSNTPVYGVAVASRNDDVAFCTYMSESSTGSSKRIVCFLPAGTYYIWGKVAAASKNNGVAALKILNT